MSVPSTQSQQSNPSQLLERFKLPSQRFAMWLIVLFVISIVGVSILLIRLHYADLQDIVHRNLHNLLVVQEQFNRKLLTDLDDLTLALATNLRESELDVEVITQRYNAFIKDDLILRTLLILDADGTIIFDSRPEQPAFGIDSTDRDYYSVHLTQRLDELYIDQPAQSRVDGAWSIPMSRAVYDDKGDLLNVIVASVSPLFWSESLNEFNALNDYVGILTSDDGIVLTTFPYIKSLVRTQLSPSRFSSLTSSTVNADLLPSFIDDKLTLIERQQIKGMPVTLIIETTNTEALLQVDSIVMMITLVSVATVVSGMAVLFLYSRQHDALRLQTDNLYQTNLNLQQEIQSHGEAEVALQESEKRYRTVTELISDYAFSVIVREDGTRQHDWITESFSMITGYTSKEIDGFTSPISQIYPDDAERVKRDLELTLSGQETITEYRTRTRSGEYIWLRVKRRPIWDKDKKRVIKFIGAATNITAEKEAELALQESRQRYRDVVELMSDYAYSLTVADGKVSQVDWIAGSLEEITGVTIEEAINDPFNKDNNLIYPDDSQLLAADMERTLKGHKTSTEYRIIHLKTKELHWLRVTRKPIWGEDQTQVVRVLAGGTDITAEKQAEMALHDSEERYRMLTQLLTDYAFSIRIEDDGQLYREWLVGDFESIMGYSIPSAGYFVDNIVQRLGQDNAEMMQSDIERTLRGEASVVENQIINRKDNKPRWIRTTRQPIWNKDHTKVSHYLGAVKDITLEKEAELIRHEADQLRQDLEREKGLHELRSRFVSMVTHEFRNPLAAIQSSVDILHIHYDRISDKSRQEKFERIYGQIARLTSLLEDLLQVGELEDYALHFLPQQVDMLDIINDLYIEYSDSIGHEHNLVLDTDLHKAMTYGDVQLIRQALGNVISNAIKYSPANSDVICKVALVEQQIVISVIDNGMGIPENDYDQLFKAFYRASNVSTQPGTGLGLLIAQQAIELHHGTVRFTSEIGKGTQFTIAIPQVIGKENDI